MKLFLDDERTLAMLGLVPEDGWVVARTADDAINILRTGEVTEATLDHDLGHCVKCKHCKGYADRNCACRCHLTGYFVVCWMETENIWPVDGVKVHSANPGGALKMRLAIDRHYKGDV